MIFRQLLDYETFTYTYIIGDEGSGQAMIIDSVKERVERDLALLMELGLQLTYIVDTHCHADHITGAMDLKEQTNAFYLAGDKSGIECIDQAAEDGDRIEMGELIFDVLTTPGHTEGCISLLCEDYLFTGDALLIRGCGRTDFQQGSSEALFKSVREKLFRLPESTSVFPGHDYRGVTSSTVGEEKKWNPRLNLDIDLSAFKEIMAQLKLDYPKKIDEALPKNIRGGRD